MDNPDMINKGFICMKLSRKGFSQDSPEIQGFS